MKLLRRNRQVSDGEPQPFFPESALTTGKPPEGLVFDGFAWRDRRVDAGEATRIAALEAGLMRASLIRCTPITLGVGASA
jgi:hypothetical protein